VSGRRDTEAEVEIEVPVRRVRHEDWPGVESLLREVDELHAQLAPAYFRAGARAAVEWRQLLGDATAAAWVAEAGAAGALGFLAVRIYETPPDPTMVPRRRAHLETLVVATRARRRGIGRRLVTAATDWARAQGAVEMLLTTWAGNVAADAFYERLGYRVLSRVLHSPL
jgi:ribosomal protein S18 acetylase RimI-like enzyme